MVGVKLWVPGWGVKMCGPGRGDVVGARVGMRL